LWAVAVIRALASTVSSAVHVWAEVSDGVMGAAGVGERVDEPTREVGLGKE
jgi:hypothetical protein